MSATKKQAVVPVVPLSPTGLAIQKITVIDLPPAIIAEQLTRFVEEADKAVEAATNIEVKDQASYDSATDVAASIVKVSKDLETTRKRYTSPLEDAKKKLIAVFNKPGDRLTSSIDAIKRKMGAFRAAEQERRNKEAAEAQAAARAEAQRLAAATAAAGDKAGAEQIIAEAAQITIEAPKVVGSGAFGSTATVTKRPSGEITDKREFLLWALENAPEVIAAAEIGKSTLNSLARRLLDLKPAPLVPGFKYSLVESDTIR